MIKTMLVDDEPFILRGLGVLLDWEKQGFSIVKRAENGRQAYEYLLENEVDFIISDIKMPEMTGLELLEKIREEKLSNAYFVILTGFADFGYAQKAIRNSCTDYILKPVDINDLTKILEKVKLLKQSSVTGNSLLNADSGWKNADEDTPIKDRNIICKKELDDLVLKINTADHLKIRKAVETLYGRFKEINLNGISISLNINYLIFNLIQLASEQNAELNQEEALNFISESSLDKGIRTASQEHIYRFACDYADYLMQLHRQIPSNVMHLIAQEIHDKYADNITLKSLSEKYELNSAYLGQLFKKQYGVYFKDYLNSVRMEKAVELLLKTDMKVYTIAEEVGYKDPDYFVDLFIKSKGCTPARFRKQKLTSPDFQ